MGKKKKKPKIGREPDTSKQPKVAIGPSSFHQQKAAWRIAHIETEAPYGWHEIDLQTFKHIKSKLAGFESMTWSEILVSGKKHHHSVATDQIIKKARDRLEAISQDDVDSLVSLKLSGVNRVWGILEEGILRLLWWDPDHEICPASKRNT